MNNNQVYLFLNTIKDEPHNLEKCMDVLYMLQRNQGPIVEVTTFLKYKAPLLYSLLKKRVNHNLGLKMLFELEFQYEMAEKRLHSHYNLVK